MKTWIGFIAVFFLLLSGAPFVLSADISVENQSSLNGTTFETSYLLKEAFPGIDALESLYYMELGVAPTFLTMGHGRNIRSLGGLSAKNQGKVLKFISRNDGSLIKTRSNFISKIDDPAAEALMRVRDKSPALARDLYVGAEKTGITGERLNNLVKAVDELSAKDVKNLNKVVRRTGNGAGDIGAAYEIEALASEGADNVAELSRNIKTTKGSSEVDGILRNNDFIEVKGEDFSNVKIGTEEFNKKIRRKADVYAAYLNENNIQGQIKFTFRIDPSQDIKTFLQSRGITWKVLPK